MDWKLILQVVGVVLGLLYLYLEYKANIWLWVVGVIMPVVHSILYFKSGLYADAGMQLYYIAAGIWGLVAWIVGKNAGNKAAASGNEKGSDGLSIAGTPARLWPVLAAVYAVLHVALYFFLRYCTDSSVPFWDAMTTAISVVAMWMLSRKYVEQWLAWCVVDAISAALYIYKGIPLTACLYMLYTALAVAGYFRWKKAAEA